MIWRRSTLALAAAFLAGSAFTDKPIRKDASSFGSLRAPDAAELCKQADAWLAAVSNDAAARAKVNALWASDRPLLDKEGAGPVHARTDPHTAGQGPRRHRGVPPRDAEAIHQVT